MILTCLCCQLHERLKHRREIDSDYRNRLFKYLNCPKMRYGFYLRISHSYYPQNHLIIIAFEMLNCLNLQDHPSLYDLIQNLSEESHDGQKNCIRLFRMSISNHCGCRLGSVFDEHSSVLLLVEILFLVRHF